MKGWNSHAPMGEASSFTTFYPYRLRIQSGHFLRKFSSTTSYSGSGFGFNPNR